MGVGKWEETGKNNWKKQTNKNPLTWRVIQVLRLKGSSNAWQGKKKQTETHADKILEFQGWEIDPKTF